MNVQLLNRVKAHTPWAIRRLSRRIKREISWAQNRNRPVSDVFHRIYAQNTWGSEGGGDGDAFYSGPGSDNVPARVYAEGIRKFIADHGIRSIVDLGCGDFRVARMIVEDGVDYTGVDIVEPLIQQNNRRFGNKSTRFACLDITNDPLPSGELCLLREVLQHLSNAEILQILPKLSQYRYAIYSDYQPSPERNCVPNRDIAHGQDTRIWLDSALFLDKPPFNTATELLFESPGNTVLLGPEERIRTFLIRQ
jgi:SAM-dependent methyltransferase